MRRIKRHILKPSIRSPNMKEKEVLRSIQQVLANMPGDWLKLTTHQAGYL
jgi:hypothetical protein